MNSMQQNRNKQFVVATLMCIVTYITFTACTTGPTYESSKKILYCILNASATLCFASYLIFGASE